MNPLEAFPGGADEARKFIHYMRDDEPKLSVRSQAVCDLALLGLDSLAADPEREAKVEGAGEQRESANLRRQVDQALTLLYDNLDECPEGLVPAVKHALDCIQGATGMVVQLNQENKKLRGDTERGAREGE